MKVATTTLVWPLSCVSLWMQGAKTCTSGEIVANSTGGKRKTRSKTRSKTRKQKARK